MHPKYKDLPRYAISNQIKPTPRQPVADELSQGSRSELTSRPSTTESHACNLLTAYLSVVCSNLATRHYAQEQKSGKPAARPV